MRLRKPCVHDRYEAHILGFNDCPGGEFLADDDLATIIEALYFDGSPGAYTVLAMLGKEAGGD